MQTVDGNEFSDRGLFTLKKSTDKMDIITANTSQYNGGPFSIENVSFGVFRTSKHADVASNVIVLAVPRIRTQFSFPPRILFIKRYET
jgi:hypothetical protein